MFFKHSFAFHLTSITIGFIIYTTNRFIYCRAYTGRVLIITLSPVGKYLTITIKLTVVRISFARFRTDRIIIKLTITMSWFRDNYLLWFRNYNTLYIRLIICIQSIKRDQKNNKFGNHYIKKKRNLYKKYFFKLRIYILINLKFNTFL